MPLNTNTTMGKPCQHMHSIMAEIFPSLARFAYPFASICIHELQNCLLEKSDVYSLLRKYRCAHSG